jgi:transcriptional regulator with XRE-family HTH domain
MRKNSLFFTIFGLHYVRNVLHGVEERMMSVEFGKLLKKLRGKRSLREIAEIADISHTYLDILERGIDPRSGKPIKPSVDMLKRLAIAFNYPYKKLMQAAGYLSEEGGEPPKNEPLYSVLCEELKGYSVNELKAIYTVAQEIHRKDVATGEG